MDVFNFSKSLTCTQGSQQGKTFPWYFAFGNLTRWHISAFLGAELGWSIVEKQWEGWNSDADCCLFRISSQPLNEWYLGFVFDCLLWQRERKKGQLWKLYFRTQLIWSLSDTPVLLYENWKLPNKKFQFYIFCITFISHIRPSVLDATWSLSSGKGPPHSLHLGRTAEQA